MAVRVPLDPEDCLVCILVLAVIQLNGAAAYYYSPKGHLSGCADGTTEGLQDTRHPRLAACEGAWQGHVENATSLCGAGWRVCGWRDQDLLRTVTWKDATVLSGCYALAAAQDGGGCKPCISDVEQDDLAGVGHGCPHQSYGQNSCISGGQIDVSCCRDTHFNKACMYPPGLATGVLCCKLPGIPPQILVKPRELTHVGSGVTFVLSCQAMGSPVPSVAWYKEGRRVEPGESARVAVFESGYLLISGAEPKDSGRYQCVVSNTAGNDTRDAVVVVTDYPSGCADGTTDSLHQYEHIQACKGSWEGHVKRGKKLCAKGWRVCTARHSNWLNLLTWTDVTQTPGCYAYNAANALNQCDRCHREDMAGVGAGCGQIRPTLRSCLAEGRIDVHNTSRTDSKGCHFVPGVTTGVLCCTKPKKELVSWWKRPRCYPKCDNGGACVDHNRCRCLEGYKGAWCQNAICPGGCIPKARCVSPGVCQCRGGHKGPKCARHTDSCRSPCLNGGRCKQSKCKCPATHYGHACQHLVKWRPLSEFNRTER